MKLLPLAGLAALVSTGLALTVWAVGAQDAERRPVAADRTDVTGLLYAQPFLLKEGYAHDWRVEKPFVTSGWLLVLEVDRDLVVPRQEFEPVLYAGDQTVERVNHGHASGRVIAVLPADPGLDLADVPIWFGNAALPEQVAANVVKNERRLAAKRGVAPFARDVVDYALATGGGPVELADRTALHRRAAELVLHYSPEDRELAESMLAPLVK